MSSTKLHTGFVFFFLLVFATTQGMLAVHTHPAYLNHIQTAKKTKNGSVYSGWKCPLCDFILAKKIQPVQYNRIRPAGQRVCYLDRPAYIFFIRTLPTQKPRGPPVHFHPGK